MSSTTFDNTFNTLVIGTDDICGYIIARTILDNLKTKIRVGYMVENCPHSKRLEEDGAEIMRFNLNDRKSIEHMFKGMECVIIVPPAYGENYNKAKSLIDVAANYKEVKCVILMSVLNANNLNEWDRLKEIYNMEKEFEKKINNWEKAYIIRQSVPMEYFYLFRRVIQEKRILPWAFNEEKITPISLCDVSEAVVRLLYDIGRKQGLYHLRFDSMKITSNKHMFSLTGKEKMNGEEIVEQCNKALDTKIELRSMELDEYIECLKQQNEVHGETLVYIKQWLEAVKGGYMSEQTQDLEVIIDKKPITVQEYFEENRNVFVPYEQSL